MSNGEFIQGFTESMAHQANVTSTYGQGLIANGTRTAATTDMLNGSWRGPGYQAAAAVGDGFQAGIAPTHARVDERSAGITQMTGQYDNQIGTSQQVMTSVGQFSVTA